MNDANEIKVRLSCPTAKYLLKELLADDYLLRDKEIIDLLHSALQRNKESMICSTHSKIVIDEHCRIFMPEYSHKEIKMPFLPKTVYLFFFCLRVVLNLKIYTIIRNSYTIFIKLCREKRIWNQKSCGVAWRIWSSR